MALNESGRPSQVCSLPLPGDHDVGLWVLILATGPACWFWEAGSRGAELEVAVVLACLPLPVYRGRWAWLRPLCLLPWGEPPGVHLLGLGGAAGTVVPVPRQLFPLLVRGCPRPGKTRAPSPSRLHPHPPLSWQRL